MTTPSPLTSPASEVGSPSGVCWCAAVRLVGRAVEAARNVLADKQSVQAAQVLLDLGEASACGATTRPACADCANVAGALRYLVVASANPRLTLTDVARAAAASKWHVSRRVASLTDAGFTTNLQRLRIVAAVRLFRDTPATVKEVAARAGFNSAAELHRQMTRHLGIPPSRARESLRRSMR